MIKRNIQNIIGKLINIIIFLFIIQYSTAQEKGMNIGFSYLNIETNKSSKIITSIGFDILDYYFDIGSNYSTPEKYNNSEHNTITLSFNIGYEINNNFYKKYLKTKKIFFIPTVGFIISKNLYKYDNFYMADNAIWYPNVRLITKYVYDKNFGFIIGIGNIEVIKFGIYLNLDF